MPRRQRPRPRRPPKYPALPTVSPHLPPTRPAARPATRTRHRTARRLALYELVRVASPTGGDKTAPLPTPIPPITSLPSPALLSYLPAVLHADESCSDRINRSMKVLCSACEAAEARVVCCADEAALCARCDRDVHAANRLAGKHYRLPLLSAASNPPAVSAPNCDICQVLEFVALSPSANLGTSFCPGNLTSTSSVFAMAGGPRLLLLRGGPRAALPELRRRRAHRQRLRLGAPEVPPHRRPGWP